MVTLPILLLGHGSLIIHIGHMQTHSLALSYRKPAKSPQSGLEHCFRQYDYREFKWSNSSTPYQPGKATRNAFVTCSKVLNIDPLSHAVRKPFTWVPTQPSLTLWTEKNSKNIHMHALELQETQSYVAWVRPINSTQLDSWAYVFFKR